MRKLFNLFKGFLAYNYGLTKNFNHPTIDLMETTNICNLSCPICPRVNMKRKQGIISDELFKKIIGETKKYTRFLWLHHFGEPLVDKNIYERIRYCKSQGVGVGLSTNGTLFNEYVSKKILESGLDKILISFDGATKETYEKIRKGGNFEKTKEEVTSFLKMKKLFGYNKPRVIMQIIKMNETEKEIKNFEESWKGLVDEISVKSFNTWGNQIKTTSVLPEQLQNYHKKQNSKRPPCYYLWHSLIIYWDGSVAVCCRDYDAKLILGNVTKDKLEDLWNCEKMVALRQAHIKGDFNNPLCKNCYDYPDVAPSKLMFTKNNIKKVFKHLKKKSVN